MLGLTCMVDFSRGKFGEHYRASARRFGGPTPMELLRSICQTFPPCTVQTKEVGRCEGYGTVLKGLLCN